MKYEHEKNKAKESQLLLTHLQQQVQRQEDEIAAYREYHEALSPEYLQFRIFTLIWKASQAPICQTYVCRIHASARILRSPHVCSQFIAFVSVINSNAQVNLDKNDKLYALYKDATALTVSQNAALQLQVSPQPMLVLGQNSTRMLLHHEAYCLA